MWSPVLVLARAANESIMIGHDIKITIVDVTGEVVRVGISAPRDVPVHRQEIYLQIVQANVEAARSTSVDGTATDGSS